MSEPIPTAALKWTPVAFKPPVVYANRFSRPIVFITDTEESGTHMRLGYYDAVNNVCIESIDPYKFPWTYQVVKWFELPFVESK